MVAVFLVPGRGITEGRTLQFPGSVIGELFDFSSHALGLPLVVSCDQDPVPVRMGGATEVGKDDDRAGQALCGMDGVDAHGIVVGIEDGRIGRLPATRDFAGQPFGGFLQIQGLVPFAGLDPREEFLEVGEPLDAVERAGEDGVVAGEPDGLAHEVNSAHASGQGP